MCPLEIEILLFYHCHAGGDYRNGDFTVPAVRSCIDTFRDNGFLNPGTERMYEPTERLHVYVDALCQVPAPVQKWVIP